MKYIVEDERRDLTGDVFTQEFNNKDEAINAAQKQWDHLTGREQAQRRVYVLESINPDEEAQDHYDGNIIYEAKEGL